MLMWVFRWRCTSESSVVRRAYAAGLGRDIMKMVFWPEEGLRLFWEMMKEPSSTDYRTS